MITLYENYLFKFVMKQLFPGYSKKSESEVKDIWNKATISFDSNALLNLYRYSSSTKDAILRLISKFSDRIWLPYQVALEYNQNRYEVIVEQEKTYNQFVDSINKIQQELQTKSRPPFLSASLNEDLNKVFMEVNKEVIESIKTYSSFLNNDPIFDQLSSLFENKIGAPFSETDLNNLYKLGEERYKSNIQDGCTLLPL